MLGLDHTADELTVEGDPHTRRLLGDFTADGVLAHCAAVDVQYCVVELVGALFLDVCRDSQHTTVVDAATLAVRLDRGDGLGKGLSLALARIGVKPSSDGARGQPAGVDVVGDRVLAEPGCRLAGRFRIAGAGTGVVAAGAARSERQQRSNHNGCDDSGHATRSHLFAPSDLSG